MKHRVLDPNANLPRSWEIRARLRASSVNRTHELSDLTCVPPGIRFSCYSIPARSLCTSKLPANGVTRVSSPTPHMTHPNYPSLPFKFSSPVTRKGLLLLLPVGYFQTQGSQSMSNHIFVSINRQSNNHVCRAVFITVRAHTEAVGSNRRGVPTAW